MPGQLDAILKLLYAADPGTTTTADTVDRNVGFDVLADIEVGSILHGFGGQYDLHVTVRNLSQCVCVYRTTVTKPVPAGAGTFTVLETVNVPPFVARADPLDALDVIAVLKYAAGINTDFSVATSQPFIVA